MQFWKQHKIFRENRFTSTESLQSVAGFNNIKVKSHLKKKPTQISKKDTQRRAVTNIFLLW